MYVPDGWFQYSRFGSPIEGTKIICVKTPLKQAFNNGQSKGEIQSSHLDHRRGVPTEEEFTPTQLVESLKGDGWNLKSVIDLTYTSRYYNPKELKDLGVQHSKIFCPGKEIPSDDVYSNFASSLSSCLTFCEERDLVAVHCTHGLNRTGYLVCRYLVENHQYAPDDAIQAFNSARRHDIERENYLEHLRKGCPPLPPSQAKSHKQKGKMKSQQSCEPQSEPKPIPLFPNRHLSTEGPTPIPHSPDQIHPCHDPGTSCHRRRQSSTERTNKSHTKHPKRNKKHRKRNQSPYCDSRHLNSPSEHEQREREGFGETGGFSVSRWDGDCMEPEGLGFRDRSWMQAHTRGGARSNWRHYPHYGAQEYSEDWERRGQHDWCIDQGQGAERSQEVRPGSDRQWGGWYNERYSHSDYPPPSNPYSWHGNKDYRYGNKPRN